MEDQGLNPMNQFTIDWNKLKFNNQEKEFIQDFIQNFRKYTKEELPEEFKKEFIYNIDFHKLGKYIKKRIQIETEQQREKYILKNLTKKTI